MQLFRKNRFIGKAKIRPKDNKLLLPYQRAWVLDNSRLKIAEKSRQIGWSWASAFGIVRKKCRTDARLDAWVSSRDEFQARLFIEDCRLFAKLLNLCARSLGKSIINDDNQSALVLEFANGRRIFSLSSNPDAQAGKRGDRILDEFALNRDPYHLYEIAYPGITWGGSLEIFSTHRGTDNFFNQLITEIKHKGNPKGFSLHTVTLQTALEQGLLYKLQLKLPEDDSRQQMDESDYYNFIKSGCPDEESFLQEYCCIPGNDAEAFLSYDLIHSCEYQHQEDWQLNNYSKLNPETQLYIGMDIGREHDLSVIWVIEKYGDILFTRAIEVLRKASFDQQEFALYKYLQLPQTRRCCIDQTGIGMQFAERAKQHFGSFKVEGIHFTESVKEELAYPVKIAFEKLRIRIPADPYIRADLRAIKKTITAAGNIRFAAKRSPGGHADRFWALALAIHAANTAVAPRVSLA